MNVWQVPKKRQQGWYLDLMAPNVKGDKYAWLDPSRLYCNSQALMDCVDDLLKPFQKDDIDLVAGIDATGFILGAAIANQLRKGFLAIRKEGHLCVKTDVQDYTDYSKKKKALEMRTDVIKPGIRVLLVDQWIETGGTMEAAIKLVERQGGTVIGIATICIEESEGGKHILQNYKCSQCVPQHLRMEFNEHYLKSFKLFECSSNTSSNDFLSN